MNEKNENQMNEKNENQMNEKNENQMNEKNDTTINEVEAPLQKKKRGRPPKVDSKVFQEIWEGSSSLAEVARALGMSKSSASVKASNLRKAGTELPLFKRGRLPKKKA